MSTLATALDSTAQDACVYGPPQNRPNTVWFGGAFAYAREGVCIESLLTHPIRIIAASDERNGRSDQDRFHSLAADWRASRGHSSKVRDLAVHSAYQQIIGMGRSALPLLLEEMKERPDHWDWALRAITGTDPVPKSAWGKLKEIGAAWYAWGRENGYVK
jgi:hypothetical protein